MSNDTDIDIEEHDLLEHPTLRGVFPDLSLVKQEVDYHDEAEHQSDPINDSWHEKPSLLPYYPDGEISTDTLIIKPYRDIQPDTDDLIKPCSSPSSSSSFILPSPLKNELTESPFDKLSQARVYLDNCKKFLDESNVFCGKCNVLFAAEKSFAEHNLVHHCEEASDREERRLVILNTFTLDPGIKNVPIGKLDSENSKHTCEVCDTTFQRSEQLIGHLYKHVTSQYKCDICQALFAQMSQLEDHKIIHTQSGRVTSSIREGISNTASCTSFAKRNSNTKDFNSHANKARSKLQSKVDKTQGIFFKCLICAHCSTKNATYLAHMRRIHEQCVKSVPEMVRVKKLKCEPCKINFGSIISYNMHNRNSHALHKCGACNKQYKGNLLQLHKTQCSRRAEKIKSKLTNSAKAEQCKTKELTFIRCYKCHMHIENKPKQISGHRNKDCINTEIEVCLRCGLTFPKKKMSVHKMVHENCSVPRTMEDFNILCIANMKPVGKEVCCFPRCKDCLLCVEGPRNAHFKFNECEKDKNPKKHCKTCGLTFSVKVYKVHIPYYGCK